MSVTTELRNKNSGLSKWFQSRLNKTVMDIVNHHNTVMMRLPIIKPEEGTEFSLVGRAVSAYLTKYLGMSQPNLFKESIAARGAAHIEIDGILEFVTSWSKTIQEEALKCILLGALEAYGRNGEIDGILQPFFQTKKSLNCDDSFFAKWQPTIDDVGNVIRTIPETWQKHKTITSSADKQHKIIPNATFYYSSEIGGADAQLIYGSQLIDVRTTAKRQPFTLDNFYQQIAYLLLDSDDRHRIEELVWVYSRQQVCFIYPVEKLFKNLEQSRKEFEDMILENYLDCS